MEGPSPHPRDGRTPIHPLDPDFDPEAFFRHVARAPSRLLLLDFDGTLAPFQVERDRAFPYPGIRPLLARIVAGGHTRLVVVSGRSLEVLQPLLGLDPAPELWGSHGWERRTPDGRVTVRDPGKGARIGLERALEEVVEVSGYREGIERKPVSVAFHVRGLEGGEGQRTLEWVRTRWEPIAEEAGLDLHDFDGGIELRVPGWDKGSAVATVLDESPPGTAAAYLGDDLTDEDAFTAIRGRGLPVLVRSRYRPTGAAAWIRPPEELLDFLRAWQRAGEDSA